MKRPALAEDLVPVKELRSNLAGWLRRVDENGRPVVITQRGKAAAVLIHPAMLDELEEGRELVSKVLRGLREADDGAVSSDEDVWADIDALLDDAEGGRAAGVDERG
ncbi:MAG: type II toxin-antitoxin system Phd/YefM family antitoxin [Myxococcota bacterium]|nr:type II toxin-antitoxin system Phd/YefM family antitoxin [Myxococcota bacterium]